MEVDSTGEFEWVPAKAIANQAKHGVSLVKPEEYLNPQHLEEESTLPGLAETRYKTIGRSGPVLVTVIFTYCGKRRRMISALRASRNERERYRRRAESS